MNITIIHVLVQYLFCFVCRFFHPNHLIFSFFFHFALSFVFVDVVFVLLPAFLSSLSPYTELHFARTHTFHILYALCALCPNCCVDIWYVSIKNCFSYLNNKGSLLFTRTSITMTQTLSVPSDNTWTRWLHLPLASGTTAFEPPLDSHFRCTCVSTPRFHSKQ